MKSQETINRLTITADEIAEKLELTEEQRDIVYDVLLDHTCEELTHYDILTNETFDLYDLQEDEYEDDEY